MKRPVGIILLIILFFLSVVSGLIKVLNPLSFRMSIALLGTWLGIANYLMDIFLLIFAALLAYGFLKAKRWAWGASFAYFALYYLGQIIGLVITLSNPQKHFRLAFELQGLATPPIDMNLVTTMMTVTLVASFVVKLVVGGVIIWYVHSRKEYFRE
ncbi:hypothetical protein HY489_04355 [Candidatus Woesearchaeota archaeon]|nr:hypothetical protein [Candidatus Woesearchaeota archaeon]